MHPIKFHTRKVRVALPTPWEPAVIGVSFAVLPGTDDAINLTNKTLPQKLQINLVATLNAKALKLGGLAADGWLAEARSVMNVSHEAVSLRGVAITMEGIQAVGKVTAGPNPPDAFKEAML